MLEPNAIIQNWIPLVLNILLHVYLATSQPNCVVSGETFADNSTYEANLNTLIASLTANIGSSGFHNTSVGQNPDTVNAIVLCRGDISLPACRECISTTAPATVQQCPNRKDAIFWNETCMVRYSSQPIFGVLQTEPVSQLPSTTGAPNPQRHDEELRALLESVRGYAANGDSFKKVAAGIIGSGILRPSCTLRFEDYQFYNASMAQVPQEPLKREKGSNTTAIIVAVSVSAFAILVLIAILLRWRRMKKKREENVECPDEVSTDYCQQYDLATIRAATDDFSAYKKLGEGGFGAVYKGRLLNGEEIAVKRLSMGSGQGDTEFKNEVLLVARLQHRNLVRLVGFCLEGNERILVYEFVENASLDHFLFDFGTAILFEQDETQGHTSRIVGTFGYMSPEYERHGKISVKTDIFSFGVLVVSGKKHNTTQNGETVNLLTCMWEKWRHGTPEDNIDPILRRGETDSVEDMLRCIHIGLLCVEEDAARRPPMASVVLMLGSSTITLPLPSEPAFLTATHSVPNTDSRETNLSTTSNGRSATSEASSKNDLSSTELYPR